MALGVCTWCGRYRLVQLQTWRSPRSGAQVCGEVCPHCFYGTGRWDDCRVCRMKEARARAHGQVGVRALQRGDVLQLIADQMAQRGGRRRGA